MKLVPLSRGAVAFVDHEDYDFAMAWKWFITTDREHTVGYACRHGNGGLIWLHKEILLRAEGPPPTPRHTIGDHRNGNRLDCRRRNLRWATPSMNARNLRGFAARQLELFAK